MQKADDLACVVWQSMTPSKVDLTDADETSLRAAGLERREGVLGLYLLRSTSGVLGANGASSECMRCGARFEPRRRTAGATGAASAPA